MANGSEDNWLAFQRAFLSDPLSLAVEGFHAGSIYKLTTDQKQKAEEILLARLPEKDSRHVIGLAALKSRRAIEPLEQMLNGATARLALYIADALNRITESDKYISYMITALEQGEKEAAIELRNYPTAEAKQALYRAIAAADFEMRQHACESLLSLHNYEPSVYLYSEVFAAISPGDHGAPSQAIELLKELFQRKPE